MTPDSAIFKVWLAATDEGSIAVDASASVVLDPSASVMLENPAVVRVTGYPAGAGLGHVAQLHA
jgi:hypothetical protein